MKNKILIGVISLVIILQFFTVDHSNPSVNHEIIINDENAKMILTKACYDCHSNETNWPWYSYVAPVSWMVVDDVEHARKDLNFSNFEDYTKKRKLHKLEEIKEELEKELMPLPSYAFMHSEADLTDDEKQIIYNWVQIKINELNMLNTPNTVPTNE